MKVNLEYYKEEQDKKQVSEEYVEVLQKVETWQEDFSKTLDNKSKIKNILALSEIRENILNWYEFKQDATILELNGNYGEITGLLCKRAKKVISIESSKQYATIIEKRHRDKENLELMVGNFEEIELPERFDYVVIIGMVEHLKEALNYAKKYVKEEGTILVAVNNQFGVKAWITTKEEAKVVNNQKIAISKERLDKLLEGMELEYYYPLPDYKMPNVIYTSKGMPTISNIYRDLTYKDETVNFKEVDAYREILQNNPEDFKKFANSFLVEISNEPKRENDIKFISFSNMRKDKYRIKTIVKEKQVEKTAVNEKAKQHIRKVKKNIELLEKLGIKTLDSYQEGKIISQYVEAPTLEDKLIAIYEQQGKEAFIQEIEKYREFLKETLEVTNSIEKTIFDEYKITCEKEKLEQLTFVKYGLWDLIFQNCFVINEQYYFYDQEWQEENLPIEYILYRAILYFHESKHYISDEELWERLELTEWIPIFEQLDNRIQETIRKPLVWKIHTKDELQKNKYAKMKKELEKKEVEIQNLKAEMEQLKGENAQKNSQLSVMENSLSWKITKPLRTIRRIMR